MRTHAGANMSEKVRDCLHKFDVNDDEVLDVEEVRRASCVAAAVHDAA